MNRSRIAKLDRVLTEWEQFQQTVPLRWRIVKRVGIILIYTGLALWFGRHAIGHLFGWLS